LIGSRGIVSIASAESNTDSDSHRVVFAMRAEFRRLHWAAWTCMCAPALPDPFPRCIAGFMDGRSPFTKEPSGAGGFVNRIRPPLARCFLLVSPTFTPCRRRHGGHRKIPTFFSTSVLIFTHASDITNASYCTTMHTLSVGGSVPSRPVWISLHHA
jgi:hypothetical protein